VSVDRHGSGVVGVQESGRGDKRQFPVAARTRPDRSHLVSEGAANGGRLGWGGVGPQWDSWGGCGPNVGRYDSDAQSQVEASLRSNYKL
jgi:hypothetical protein